VTATLAKLWVRLLTLVQTDPALVMTVVQGALALVVSLGFALSAKQTGAIEGAVTAALGLIVAISTKPFRTGAATAFISAAGTVLLAFRVPHISPATVSAISVAVTGVLMLGVTSPQTMSRALINR
jgi:hypothetical protein